MIGRGPRRPNELPDDGRAPGRSGRGHPRPRAAEPPDLGALQETDALLDRLSRRDQGGDHADDPVAVLLAELARDVDLETGASRRFRAVLAGRTAQDGQWLEPDARPQAGSGGRTAGRAAAHRRLADGPRGFARRVARALPVAGTAAGVLLAVGGGLLAAVTGDPMAPLSTINRALSPPDRPVSYTQVMDIIAQASSAADQGHVDQARRLLRRAKSSLGAVPSEDSTALRASIRVVEANLATAGPAVPTAQVTGVRVGPAPGSQSRPAPSGSPTGSRTATATATGTATPTTTSTPTPTVTGSPTVAPTGTSTDLPSTTPPVAANP